MTGLYCVTVILDEKLVTLNAAVGLLRRRNLPVRSVTFGPHVTEGRSRLSAMIEADDDAARRVALLFEKLVGVDEARAVAASDTVSRELAIIRVRPQAGDYGELLDVLNLYHAAVLEEGPDGLVAELTGPDAFVLSCLRAIERFGVLDVARSGAVAIERPADRPRVPTSSTKALVP
jgi:acetolactate synthase-1/3 small subunit